MDMVGFQIDKECCMHGRKDDNDSDLGGSRPARSNNLQRALHGHNGDASERATTGNHPSRV